MSETAVTVFTWSVVLGLVGNAVIASWNAVNQRRMTELMESYFAEKYGPDWRRHLAAAAAVMAPKKPYPGASLREGVPDGFVPPKDWPTAGPQGGAAE